MTIQEKIDVMTAYRDGETIEMRVKLDASPLIGAQIENYRKHGANWYLGGAKQFNFGLYDYRVSSTVKLNEEYTAIITKDGVTVGCQTFPHSKILEVVEKIKSLLDNLNYYRRISLA